MLKLIFFNELHKLIDNKTSLYTVIAFFLSLASLIPFSIDVSFLPNIGYGVIWLITIVTINIYIINSYKNEVRKGFNSLLIQTCSNLYLYICCKVFSVYIINLIPFSIMIFLSNLIFGSDLNTSILSVCVFICVFLGVLSLSILSTVLANTGINSVSIGSIILFPLVIPFIIFSSGTIKSYTLNISYYNPIIICLCLSIVMYFIACWSICYIIKSLHGN